MVRNPLRIIVLIAILFSVFTLGFCFPEVRAACYPVFACFSRSGSLSIHPYSSTFTTKEFPVFVISTESGQFYDLALYPKIDLLKALKKRENQLDKISPYPEISKADLVDLVEPALFRSKGVFIPLDQDHAEAMIRISKKLEPNDYVAVFRSKSAFGENLDVAITRFRVTNIGALVKIDDHKAVMSVFDLISREIVRDVNIRVFLRSKGNDTNIKKLYSMNSGHEDLIEFELNELASGEPDIKERLIIDFSKANHSAFWGDIKYSDNSDFSIPLNVSSRNHAVQPSFQKRTFLSLNRDGKILNCFGQLAVWTENGIKLLGKKQKFDLEIISPENGVLLNKNVTTDDSGTFLLNCKLDSALDEEGLKLVISSNNKEEEIFDISTRAFRVNAELQNSSKMPNNQSPDSYTGNKKQTDEGWFREFDGQSIKIDFDKKKYSYGESLEATIKLPPKSNFPFLLVSLEGERIYQSRLLHVKSKPVRVSFELDDKPNPNLYLGVSTVQKGHSPRALVKEVELSLEQKKLKIFVEANQKEISAGDKVKIKVLVKDFKGAPVSGAKVVASLVDEQALLAVSKSEGLPGSGGTSKKLFETLYALQPNRVTTSYTVTGSRNQSFTKYKRFDFWGQSQARNDQLKSLPEMKNSSDPQKTTKNSVSGINRKEKSTKSSNLLDTLSGAFLSAVTDEKGEASFMFEQTGKDRKRILTIYSIDNEVRVGSLEKLLSAKY